MRYVKETAGAPLGAVLCVCACLVGCGQKEDIPSNPPPEPAPQPAATSGVARAEARSKTSSIEERAHDAAYQAQLNGLVKDREHIVKRRAQIERRMAKLREHAKKIKSLPTDATDEQVESALEGASLTAWRELVQAQKNCLAEEEKSYAVARAAVAQRILRKEQTEDRAQGTASAEK